jgi:Uma2 family endonuclease
MPVMSQGWPFKAPVAGFHRFTVEQYHKMIETGVLTENDRVELLEGYVVEKMPHDPLHDGTLQKLNRRLQRVLPPGWELRVQMVVTLPSSEPEPDAAVVRIDADEYMTRHPGPADIGLLVEVSNTTLDGDREDKLPIYARAGVAVYWIVNVVDREIEVHEQPSGAGFALRRVFRPGDHVPFALDGVAVASIPAADLLR